MSFQPELLISVARIIGLEGVSRADFQTSAGLRREFGFGVQDHNRALRFLLEKGIVDERDGRYFRGSLDLTSWSREEIIEEGAGLDSLSNLPGFNGRRKFLEGLNQEIGLIGENFVMGLLERRIDPDLKYRIEHVSLENDMAGFDIRTPSVSGVWEEVMLEVKTSARVGGDPVFYLTRNEARVGARYKNWFLVFVRLSSAGPELKGHLPFSEFEDLLPREQSRELVWSELTGKIPFDDLYADLP